MTTHRNPFIARPTWQRWLWRQWRLIVLVRIMRQERWQYVVPPREWSQESADAAIKRGHELAKEHGW